VSRPGDLVARLGVAVLGIPVVLGALVVVAGIWEYRRKLQDQITAEKYEAEAEQRQRRNRR